MEQLSEPVRAGLDAGTTSGCADEGAIARQLAR
jgi:hypothetical protein